MKHPALTFDKMRGVPKRIWSSVGEMFGKFLSMKTGHQEGFNIIKTIDGSRAPGGSQDLGSQGAGSI